MKINHADIHWNASGTPTSSLFDDVYFSNHNGLEEARYVFLSQNQLQERWLTSTNRRFVIAETGFGTGLNFLASWQQFEQHSQANPSAACKQLHYVSFEKFPLSIDDFTKAHEAWPHLKPYSDKLIASYPPAMSGCQRLIFANGMITLDLWFGDVNHFLPSLWASEQGIVDAWFLDGFAPSKNPDMWQDGLFNEMARLSKVNATLATFTSAGFVRRGLMKAGFQVSKAKGYGQKREMLTGVLLQKNAPTRTQGEYLREPEQVGNDDYIAIIGGGVASACLAIALTQRGKKVTLYCKDNAPAQGASGNRQGAVYPLLSKNDEPVSHFFSPAFLFARQFIDAHTTDIAYKHEWCGVTHLAWDKNTEKKLQGIANAGFPPSIVTPISIQEAEKLADVPLGIGGVQYPLGGWLCPQELTQGLIKKALATGLLTCAYDHEITEIQHKNSQWHLSVNNDVKTHRIVILANGHLFNAIEQSAPIPAYSVRGQVSHINTTETLKSLKTVLCYQGYLTPVDATSDTHCIGASYSRNDESLLFRQADQAENKKKLTDSICHDWTHEIDTNNTDARVGIRTASRDHLPFIGNICNYSELVSNYKNTPIKDSQLAVTNYPNLFCMLALGSRGLTSAPLGAECLASQICNEPLPLSVEVLNALHPARSWLRKMQKGKMIKEKK